MWTIIPPPSARGGVSSSAKCSITQADLCDLRGARFARTSECESGQRLSEARLKAITQGMGTIKATRKYENPITFPETHKLWLDTNERPAINSDDEGTLNRLHSIPFSQAVAPEKIDKALGRKLKKESEGILAWVVAGALDYFDKGLDKPDEVEASTREWRAESDNVGRFIDNCCVKANPEPSVRLTATGPRDRARSPYPTACSRPGSSGVVT
jgi:putative DNA primase/helicase